MAQLTIALDIMGGDHGPPVILAAAIKAVKSNPEHHFILCGDESFIQPRLADLDEQQRARVTIEHCQQVVEMGEKPTDALRKKKNSSRLAKYM